MADDDKSVPFEPEDDNAPVGDTDEHGTDWGFPEGKGRKGLWVTDHSRAGVKRAMRQRLIRRQPAKGDPPCASERTR